MQGDELGHEAEHVQAHADHEPPLAQQPDDQARVDASQASSADLLLAARTAIACITAATPYSTAATMAAIRLTSTAHLPRFPG